MIRNILIVLSLLLLSGVAFGQGTALTTERVASGLTEPLFVTFAPGDSLRIFILEQPGRVKILKNGTLLPQSFLDISSEVSGDFEQGLLGMAFSPDFQSSGEFYIDYTDTEGDVQVERWSVSATNPDSADENSRETIISVFEPEPNHNGGMITFGPDGYFYIALGDGGGSGDQHGTIGNGQDSTNALGTILRLDVSVGGPGYAIPPDNPFVGRSGLDEIWAYGLRNPWRFSFDRETGDLYIADVGQGAYEEVNFQPASSAGGENYGWRRKEATHCFLPPSGCEQPGLTDPITEYDHDLNDRSISGGYVYRGCAIPDLRGTYFYADFISGRIWSVRYDGTTKTDSTVRTTELDPPGSQTITRVSSFGEDAYGELYICDHFDGEVYKIIAAEPVQSDCPTESCCTVAGDAGNDGQFAINDAVYIVNHVFKGGPAPACLAAADANGDCEFNISDATYIINHVFRGGPAPTCSECI
jgi:glucose/arabinose dehydrogenase